MRSPSRSAIGRVPIQISNVTSMLKYSNHAKLPLYSFVLSETRACGPVMGYFGEYPLAESVVDSFGRHYRYVGLAPRLRNGKYDLDALRPGEWIVEPGVNYAYASSLH